jgi:hypothetical protein
MQNRLIILLIALTVSLSSRADTCPPVDQIDLNNPPPGWQVLVPPVVDDEQYYFGKAIHSLNGGFFYGQVLCVYETCGSFGCPAFELLSEGTYKKPNAPDKIWSGRSIIVDTLTCAPANHDPSVCTFE